MLKVSHSRIKVWRHCRKLYAYRYIEKLKPRRKPRPLVFGSIVHEMIEAHANGDEPQDVVKKYRAEAKKLFSVERPEYEQIVNEAELLMHHYFKYYAKDKIKFVAIKGKLAEHSFEVPLTKGIVLIGKIDAIIRTPDDQKWLGEHKSHKEIPKDDVRLRDLQTVLYTDESVMKSLGIKNISGVLWDYIRSKAPSIPEMTKKGKLSTAKIDTFQSIYLEAIKRNNLDPKDYAKILKDLEGHERSFFKRVFMPLNPTISKQLLSETVVTAKEMQEKGGSDCTRNITFDCGRCSHQSLCIAELTGMDADYIRKSEFIVKEKEYEDAKPGD